MRFPLSKPTLGEQETAYVLDAVQSGWISGIGPYVSRFEAELSAKLGRAHVVAVGSGTVALEITLQALGIGPGDEVIVPALTFAAPAAAVLNAGATPVLCDIDEATWTINAGLAGGLVTERTKAVIAVDLLGHPCDFGELNALGVPIIEDAAQAHGARSNLGPAGSFGTVSTFSFHANKAVTTGEGGCIATDDADLAAALRLLVNHGMSPARPYHHHVAGRNGRMTNLTAAVGCAQVERWDELIRGRLRVEAAYSATLGVRDRPRAGWAAPSCWLYTFQHDERERLIAHARAHGVDARAVWPALSDLPLYRPFAPRPCPVAGLVSRSAAWLPTWSHMSQQDIDAVAGIVCQS